MRKRRLSPDLVALYYIWPALLFAAVWVWLPQAKSHLTVGVHYTYALLAVVALLTVYRTRTTIKKPHSPVIKYLPIADAIVLALAIRFTGGVNSQLWVLYYLQLIAGAMDTRPRTIEVIAPLVVVSYFGAVIPDAIHWDVIELIGTRLFFLFLTGMLARHIARVRNSLSEELGRLSEQLSVSQERNRISREIHDGIGHSLVNCILTLELCERLVCKEPQEACKVIRQEKEDLRSALEDMRDYVHHLRPAELENEPFAQLIERYLTRFAERTGVQANLDMKTAEVNLQPSSRLVFLRILQEALTNAAKHADATEVKVCVTRAASGGVNCLIEDNGSGFDEEEVLRDSASRQGFGLRTMIDRAKSAGGDLRIESEPGEGTRISIYMPS